MNLYRFVPLQIVTCLNETQVFQVAVFLLIDWWEFKIQFHMIQKKYYSSESICVVFFLSFRVNKWNRSNHLGSIQSFWSIKSIAATPKKNDALLTIEKID